MLKFGYDTKRLLRSGGSRRLEGKEEAKSAHNIRIHKNTVMEVAVSEKAVQNK